MDRKMDPRIQRSRRMLIDSIIELVSTGCLEEGLTVRDIVAHAKLNRSTFYLHFRDKQDLLDQAIGEILSELKDAYQSTPAYYNYELAKRDFVELHKPLDATTGLFEQVGKYAELYQTLMHNERFQTTITGIISHELAKFISNEIMVAYMAYGTIGAVNYWLASGKKLTVHDMSMWVTRMYLIPPGVHDILSDANSNHRPRDET